jgi:hypothetical protein
MEKVRRYVFAKEYKYRFFQKGAPNQSRWLNPLQVDIFAQSMNAGDVVPGMEGFAVVIMVGPYAVIPS